jgi:uncharacterized phage protein (TIGR01671 family)
MYAGRTEVQTMREILFRGKEKDQWVSGYYWKYEQNGKEFHVIRDSADKLLKFNHICDPKTLGQYTGLTDKNGVKIFEGDIVRYNDTIHKVIFCTINGCAFFGITMPDRGEIWNFDGITCANKMEVIGNIHDDPELIGGVK